MNVINFDKEKINYLFENHVLPIMKKNFFIHDFYRKDDESIFVIEKSNIYFVFLKYLKPGTKTDKITIDESLSDNNDYMVAPRKRVSHGEWYIEKIKLDAHNKYELLREKMNSTKIQLNNETIISELKKYIK